MGYRQPPSAPGRIWAEEAKKNAGILFGSFVAEGFEGKRVRFANRRTKKTRVDRHKNMAAFPNLHWAAQTRTPDHKGCCEWATSSPSPPPPLVPGPPARQGRRLPRRQVAVDFPVAGAAEVVVAVVAAHEPANEKKEVPR